MQHEYMSVVGFYCWNKISLHGDQDGGCKDVNVRQNVSQLDKVEIETGWRTYQHFLLENVLGCRLVVGEHICFSWRTYLASGWRTFLDLENCGRILSWC